MAVETFLTRMNALVDELRAHPKVTLLNYDVPPPATEEDFAAVETHLGFQLPQDIKTFYRQCNGLQLRWVHKDNKNVDQKLWSAFMEGGFDYEECEIEKYIDGVVNIMPIRIVFLTDWNSKFGAPDSFMLPKSFELAGTSMSPETVLSSSFAFDLFNVEYHFALQVDQARQVALVIVYDNRHQVPAPQFFSYFDLSTYLDYLLQKKGGSFDRIQCLRLKTQGKKFGKTIPWAQSIDDEIISYPESLERPYYQD